MPDRLSGVHALNPGLLAHRRGWPGKPSHGARRCLAEIANEPPFHKHSQRFSPCSAGPPELRLPPLLSRLCVEARNHRRAVEPELEYFRASAWGKGLRWTAEARATSLGPPRPTGSPEAIPGAAPAGPAVALSASTPREWQGASRLDMSGCDLPAPADLGTNNCRLLVARATRGRLPRRRCLLADHPAGRRRHPVRAAMSEAAILRAVDALRVCRAKIRIAARHARPADRDGSLPRRREWHRFPGTHSQRGRD